MKGWKAVICVSPVILAVTGCVRSDVSQLSPDVAIISARGTAFDSMADLQKEIMAEAARATLKAGYDSFYIVDGQAGYATGYAALPGYYSEQSSGSAVMMGNSVAGSSVSSGFYTGSSVSAVSKPNGSVQIKMFKGTPPAGSNAFDARAVLESIDAQ